MPLIGMRAYKLVQQLWIQETTARGGGHTSAGASRMPADSVEPRDEVLVIGSVQLGAGDVALEPLTARGVSGRVRVRWTSRGGPPPMVTRPSQKGNNKVVQSPSRWGPRIETGYVLCRLASLMRPRARHLDMSQRVGNVRSSCTSQQQGGTWTASPLPVPVRRVSSGRRTGTPFSGRGDPPTIPHKRRSASRCQRRMHRHS